jgi:hypothetical protein
MIQKIRSYLLDDEDNKDFIGWYVVIIMLFPIIGMIFQYRKSVINSIGKVNNKEIERSIFNIKVFEQSKLMENITKMFGEEQSNYFFDMLFQGKSVEQFVLSGEIRRIFLHQKFEKLISKDHISGEYINFNLKNKSLDKIKNSIGELPFLLITGQLKPSLLNSLNVNIEKIDVYCKEVFDVALLNNIFLVPLSTIEKLIFNNYTGLPLKINFTVYSFSLKDDLNEYKKTIDVNTIGENEMKVAYDSGIKQGDYRKPRTVTFSLSTYSLKDKDGNGIKKITEKEFKSLNRDIFNRWNLIKEENKGNFDFVFKSLEKDFYCKDNNKNCKIVFTNSNELLSSSVKIPQGLKEKIILLSLSNEKKNINEREKFIDFVEEGLLFLVENFDLSLLEYNTFDEVKSSVIDSIVTNRAKNLVKLDMEKIRYSLEKKDSVGISLWKKGEKTFSHDLDIKNQNQDEKAFYELVNKKLYSGGLRVGSTFLSINEDTCTVYYVSGITYEVENKFVVRKDQFYNRELFVESIERFAKIEMND